MNVNESGRNGEAGGLDNAGRGPAREMPHGGDLALADSDIAVPGGVSSAVGDAAAEDENIEIRRGGKGGDAQKQEP